MWTWGDRKGGKMGLQAKMRAIASHALSCIREKPVSMALQLQNFNQQNLLLNNKFRSLWLWRYKSTGLLWKKVNLFPPTNLFILFQYQLHSKQYILHIFKSSNISFFFSLCTISFKITSVFWSVGWSTACSPALTMGIRAALLPYRKDHIRSSECNIFHRCIRIW